MKTDDRLAFANTLRGIACVAVLISHYIFTFDAIHGAYDGYSALPFRIYPAWVEEPILSAKLLELGSFGVALFFLISGLVIPFSVDAMSTRQLPRMAFLIARFFRIVPTYAVGAAISIAALILGARYNGNLTYWIDVETYLTNVSMFRDWIGTQQFDGVVWTLEVEAKFYLMVVLLWALLSRRSLLFIAAGAIAAIAAARFRGHYPLTWNPPENFVWYLKYLAFMCIGVAFNFHYRGTLNGRRLTVISVCMMSVFAAVGLYEKLPTQILCSYLVSLILFSWLYARRRDWTGGRTWTFFARISFSLYAVHAPLGYVSIRILLERGWGGLSAFAIVTPCVVLVAWLVYVLIEQPAQALGKRLATRFQNVAARLRPGTDDSGQPQV